jgi:hypothetical protein
MMKRAAFACAILLSVIPLVARAQVDSATPSPDPSQYNDTAMHFRAPAGYLPVGQRHISLKDLPSDPVTVAGWIFPSRNNPRRIIIQEQAFTGTLGEFSTTFQQQLRNELSGTLIKNKQDASLENGMPAKYMETVIGSGFNEQKAFMYIWVDGQRGVSLTVMAPLGVLNTKSAQAILAHASAVAYPVGRQ